MRRQVIEMFCLFVLVLSMGSMSIASPEPPQGRIAFGRNIGGNEDIYVVDPDGRSLSRLTDDPGCDWQPTWSPDGRQIAFASNREGHFRIYIANADGSNVRRLTHGEGSDGDPAWSPDGKWIAYSHYDPGDGRGDEAGGETSIWRVNVADGAPHRVTQSLGYDSMYLSPTWSPDGQFIFIESCNPESVAGSISVVRVDGSAGKYVVSGDRVGEPACSPDGSLLALSASAGIDGWIHVIAAGSRGLELPATGLAVGRSPAWSPDGRHIAYRRSCAAGLELCIMTADGKDIRRLVDCGSTLVDPSWSPAVVTGQDAAAGPTLLSEMANRSPSFISDLTWGQSGSADGSFHAPCGIDVDSSGNVYVMDYENHRVQKFAQNGAFVAAWGELGAEAGQFANAAGLAVDASSNVYVLDSGNRCIQKFTPEGRFIKRWPLPETVGGEFSDASGIAVDASGCVYVAAAWSHRVWKCSADGESINSWSSAPPPEGEYDFPVGSSGIAVDSSGNIYVVNTEHGRIEKFDPQGRMLSSWEAQGGSGGAAVDEDGNLYVADGEHGRVVVFSPNGALIGTLGGDGRGVGRFDGPSDVAIDARGCIYVTETRAARVHRFRRQN